jgi:hypothetical protein
MVIDRALHHTAATWLRQQTGDARQGALEPDLSRPAGRAIVDAATRREAGTTRQRRVRRAAAPSGSRETADVGG